MKYIGMILIVLASLMRFISPVEAARLLPRFKTKRITSTKVTTTVITSPRLRADKKAIVVSFGNLDKAVSVFYTFLYKTDGKDEGVSGTIDKSAGTSATRELLFGTCSSGVCRYHTGLSGVRFEATIELPSGKRIIRRYRIKI